jgi:hypothetical protein
MTIKWQPISKALHDIYEEQNILSHFEHDECYLKQAFEFTEKLWHEQYEKIDTLKTIMISEAPLFGDKQTYIYNINAKPSAFFHFNDLEAFSTYHEIVQNPQNPIEKKKIMLKHFIKNGFLILDIFPFALNPNITKINYRNVNQALYHNLLNKTQECYLKPKIEMCLKKSQDTTLFLYRYKRLFELTENHFEHVLNSVSPKRYTVDTVNGTNMSLDRDRLQSLLIENS